MARFTSTSQPAGRGRKKGSTNKLPTQLKEALPEVIDSVVTKAKEGDMAAAALLFKYTLPTLKPVEQSVELYIPFDSEKQDKLDLIEQKLLDGELNHEQANSLMEFIVKNDNSRNYKEMDFDSLFNIN